MHNDEIHDLAIKLSEDAAGSNGYLGCYAKARQQVEEKLTELDRQKYRSMAQAWSNQELPSGVQERYVLGNDSTGLKLANHCYSMMKNHGTDALKEFTRTMFNQFGMRIVVLGAHIDHHDDDVAVSL